MALVSAGYFSTVSLSDTNGNVSTLTYRFNPVTITTLALALTAQSAMNTVIGNLTDSEISAYSVGERFTEDALTLPASAQNEVKASVSFSKSGYGLGNLKVPAPKVAVWQGASGAPSMQVDLTAGILTAYTNKFVTGDDYTINDGEFLVSLIRGKRVTAKNNNG